MTLNLDIDVVRGLLGAWLDHANAAGMRARELALAMARTNLLAGDDVIVPQLLARPRFIDELEHLANDVEVRLIEVTLMASRHDVDTWFAIRSAAARSTTHIDAQALAERLGPDELDRMYTAFIELVASRPHTKVIQARSGGLEVTLRELQQIIGDLSG